jgi:HTH-type transcriptional regulator/antitoxin HipB
MSDLDKYIKKRKSGDSGFAQDYDSGYEQFKIGVLLKKAREEAGFTQEELAEKLNTKKSAISRIENHAEDIKLSTLKKFANALGKELRLEVAQAQRTTPSSPVRSGTSLTAATRGNFY